MHCLLVNPWIHDFSAYDLWAKPLGLLKIASYLKQSKAEVSLIDCLDRFHPHLRKFPNQKPVRSTIFGDGNYYSEIIAKPDIFKSIPRRFKRYGIPIELFETLINREITPDIILVTSAMTYWYPGVFEAIKLLRQRFSDVPIVLGGIYAQLCFEHAKKFSGATLVYNGNNLTEIAKILCRLTYKKLEDSGSAKPVFPAYELYPHLPYITLRTSSGCPFKCSYCGWYLLEKGFKQENPDFIAANIEHFYQNNLVKNFAFYDEALLYNAEEHIVKILNDIIHRKLIINIHTPNGMNIRFITPQLARLFKTAGFVKPRLGFDIISLKKQPGTEIKATKEEFLIALQYLKNEGFLAKDIGVNLLIGRPNQDFNEIKQTIDFLVSLRIRIFLEEYSPIPNTPDYLNSGLPRDADPLLHNNSAFPLYRLDEHLKFQRLKDLAHKSNKDIS